MLQIIRMSWTDKIDFPLLSAYWNPETRSLVSPRPHPLYKLCRSFVSIQYVQGQETTVTEYYSINIQAKELLNKYVHMSYNNLKSV